jgi:predicted small secreted protein
MSHWLRIATGSALLAALALLTGCNTMAGLGKDIERGGEKTQELANDVKQKL